MAGSGAEDNYSQRGAPRESGTAFSHVAALLAEVGRPLFYGGTFH